MAVSTAETAILFYLLKSSYSAAACFSSNISSIDPKFRMVAEVGVVEVAQKEVFLVPLVSLDLDPAVVLEALVVDCHCSCIYPS